MGGKGMGGGGTQVSYTYSASFAIGLCEGPIIGVRDIWADSKLIYDVSGTATVGTLQVSQRAAAIANPKYTSARAIGVGSITAT